MGRLGGGGIFFPPPVQNVLRRLHLGVCHAGYFAAPEIGYSVQAVLFIGVGQFTPLSRVGHWAICSHLIPLTSSSGRLRGSLRAEGLPGPPQLWIPPTIPNISPPAVCSRPQCSSVFALETFADVETVRTGTSCLWLNFFLFSQCGLLAGGLIGVIFAVDLRSEDDEVTRSKQANEPIKRQCVFTMSALWLGIHYYNYRDKMIVLNRQKHNIVFFFFKFI